MAARATLWNFARRRAERMRHVRAASRRCTVTFRGNHLHTAHRHVRTPQDRILDKCKAYRKRSRQRDAIHYLEAGVRLAGVFRVRRRDAPRSQHIKSFISRRRNLTEFKLTRGTNRRRTIKKATGADLYVCPRRVRAYADGELTSAPPRAWLRLWLPAWLRPFFPELRLRPA